jgi:hypothetical protein
LFRDDWHGMTVGAGDHGKRGRATQSVASGSGGSGSDIWAGLPLRDLAIKLGVTDLRDAVEGMPVPGFLYLRARSEAGVRRQGYDQGRDLTCAKLVQATRRSGSSHGGGVGRLCCCNTHSLTKAGTMRYTPFVHVHHRYPSYSLLLGPQCIRIPATGLRCGQPCECERPPMASSTRSNCAPAAARFLSASSAGAACES